ncbi:MAG: hypothetical protein K2X77_32060 [Candidatus Obscuribacterales bacterium]|jgi:hypothetical protein|nr:hypothetical protein [Candidatus Obscuribacterales bacterium]
MKSSFRVLTIAISLAIFSSVQASLADEAADWLNDIGADEPSKKAAPAPVKKAKPAADSAAKGESTKTKSEGWSLSDAIQKQENADSQSKKENKAVALIKKLKPKAVTDEAEMTKDFRPTDKTVDYERNARSESEADANQYGTLDSLGAASLRSHAKTHLKKGQIKTARKLAERAIELDSENTDGRQIYAEALRAILKRQSPRDPHTYNLCVKQWYWLSKHSEFDDDANAANAALKEITGVAPAVWLRPKSYLSKVLMPEDGVTAAELADEPDQVR